MQNLVSLGLMARYMKISEVFYNISQFKSCDSQGGAKFDPRAIIWALLVEAHWIGLHAKFSRPRPYC